MTDEVWKWIKQENLILPGDFVLAGVSGGADSVCLLLLLLERREELGFPLEVVHVEHGIRGAESREDARFVEELCATWKVPCHTYSVNVPEYAASHGIGLEEAARILRYDCYRAETERILHCDCRQKAAPGMLHCDHGGDEAAQPEYRNVKIALAHHADDNAETMLFQMARGSGIKGLCGMRSRRILEPGITIVRPLLMTTRDQIEQYLAEKGQSFRQDGTNLDTDYSRNRIRHEVMPQLKKVNSQVVSHMNRSAEMLAELYDYLMDEVTEILPEVCVPEAEENGSGVERNGVWKKKDGIGKGDGGEAGAYIIRQELFERYPVILQKEAVHQILGNVAGSSRDIGSVHVEAVRNLAGLQVGRSLSLPYQMRAERVYEGIRICRVAESGEKEMEEYVITPETLLLAEREEGVTIPLPDGKMQLYVRDACGEIWKNQKKTYTKWLNYDKIKCGLRLRRRAAGDYLTIDEMGHKKKLKEYLIAEKVPRDRRNQIWLLAEDAHILWVVGGRISADYKVEQDTKKILEVRISGGNYREDQED